MLYIYLALALVSKCSPFRCLNLELIGKSTLYIQNNNYSELPRQISFIFRYYFLALSILFNFIRLSEVLFFQK